MGERCVKMARIIPAAHSKGSPPEVIRLFLCCQAAAGDVVRLAAAAGLHGPGPDFWLARRDRVLFLLVRVGRHRKRPRGRRPDGLFGGARPPIGEGEGGTGRFFASIARDGLPSSRPPSSSPISAGRRLAGGNRMRRQGRLGRQGNPHAGAFARLAERRISSDPDPPRKSTACEGVHAGSRRPAAFTVRQPIERHTEAELGHYLLDYRPGTCAQTGPELARAGQTTAQDFSCGSSTASPAAANRSSSFTAPNAAPAFPRKRILILTHNRALIRDLRRRYPAERRRPGRRSGTPSWAGAAAIGQKIGVAAIGYGRGWSWRRRIGMNIAGTRPFPNNAAGRDRLDQRPA